MKPAAVSFARAAAGSRLRTSGTPLSVPGCRAERDVELDARAALLRRPGLRRLRDHGSLRLVRRDVYDARLQPGRVELLLGRVLLLGRDVGHGDRRWLGRRRRRWRSGGGGGGGTAAVLPLETFSRTVEPPATRFPPCGFCATTLPFGCEDGTMKAFGFEPGAADRRDGVVTRLADRVRHRHEPARDVDRHRRAARDPRPGLRALREHRPGRLASRRRWPSPPGSRSTARCSTAAASRWPTTFGTASVCTAETVSVTTECLTTFAPGFGSCATTVPGSAVLAPVRMRAIRPRAFSRCTASRASGARRSDVDRRGALAGRCRA